MPYLGVFLVLLFIVMVFPFPVGRGIGLDLPKTHYYSYLPAAVREDAMRIAVTRDGKFYFGSHQVTPTTLPAKIREALQSGTERRVYLLVDARTKYLEVKPVLDAIRQAGLQRISFLAEGRRQ